MRTKYIPELLEEILEQLKQINEKLVKEDKNADDKPAEEAKKRGRKPKERKDTDENAETEGISEHNLEETQE